MELEEQKKTITESPPKDKQFESLSQYTRTLLSDVFGASNKKNRVL